jgi:hypothetical protein
MHAMVLRRYVLGLLTAITLGAGGCASTGPRSPGTPAAAFSVSAGAARCYSDTDIARIESMREQGSSLADVVEAVGGTTDEVRDMEQRLRVARRNGRGGVSEAPSTCAQLTAAP